MAPVPFFLVLIAFDLWHNWRFLVFLAFCVAMGWYVPKLVHFKRQPRSRPTTISHVIVDIRESPSPIDLEMEDAKYEGTGWRMLEVRKGWARVAVACDTVIVALVGVAVTTLFADPAKAAQDSASARFDASMVIGAVVAITFFAFNVYAHKKATQPRKPKRAWLPAFLRTNV